jgi:flavorubredoxin
MSGPFKAIKISDHVYWVGAIDWAIRDFHGYRISRGSTYNAYLIMADKITLIDTVKYPFRGEMQSRIASVINPEEISYVVSGHAEMDHSGTLPDVIEEMKPEKVFASSAGVKALQEHFHLDDIITGVEDGERISLGNWELMFIETRMLHWPESMFTYLMDDNLLFSQDAFGMHLASHERFDDELNDAVLEEEASRYFANILLPYSHLITKLLDRAKTMNLNPDLILPAHGPVWRKRILRILELYGQWAAQKPTLKAVIVYDTMWQSTAMMARAIAEGLTLSGVRAVLMPLGASHRSDVVAELLDAGALLIGSPTLNSGMLPTVADLLTYLKGLKPQNLIGAAFGSYGWANAAVPQIEEMLASMKIPLVSDGLKVKFVPTSEDLLRCVSLGSQVADKLKSLNLDKT